MKRYRVTTVDKFSGELILEPKVYKDLYEARQRAQEIQAHTEWGITWIYDREKGTDQIVEVYQ